MTKDVYVSIRGLHSIGDDHADDIEVMYPASYRKVRSTHCIRYLEQEENAEESTANTILIRPDMMEVIRRGSIDTRMIFEKGKKTWNEYTTPLGSISLGIYASRIHVEEREDLLAADVVYALDVNGNFMSDCVMEICVQPGDNSALEHMFR